MYVTIKYFNYKNHLGYYTLIFMTIMAFPCSKSDDSDDSNQGDYEQLIIG